MRNDDRIPQDGENAKPADYTRPVLTRWGTLRELTEGGGGNRREPASIRRTRF